MKNNTIQEFINIYTKNNQFKVDVMLLNIERIRKNISELYQDEHPVDCIDGVTPFETYGYESTRNQALEEILNLSLPAPKPKGDE